MREVLAFLFCGLVWGSSFYWIKVALEELPPLTLVAFRLAVAVGGMAIVAVVRKRGLPRDAKTLFALIVLSLLTPAVPFFLTAWSETHIDSGLASVLNATMPLLTTLAAHFAFKDDRMTVEKILGVVAGFAGILILFSRDFGNILGGDGLGQLAMLGASVLYALGSVLSRQLLRTMTPFDVTFGQMLFGDIASWVLAAAYELPLRVPHLTATWVALVWMGLLGSFLSFLAYHWLSTHWGASRTSLTNYVVPVVALILGLGLRGEHGDWRLALGAALILSGVAIVNARALLAPLLLKVRVGRGRTAVWDSKSS